MDARFFRAAVLVALVPFCAGASYRTANFVIHAPDAQLAQGLAKAAEEYRRDLALSWLGYELPRWSSPCPVQVRVGSRLGAGGITRFYFVGTRATGWEMSIQGSRERLFDSVLPHEITHTVLATHFGCKLPRWADEGAATSVECKPEQTRHHRMLIDFLRHGRGISFRRMFPMLEYPRDSAYMLSLYAQGYSLTKYLIQRGGRRKFIKFVEEGIRTNHWSAALQRHYGAGDVMALQNVWLDWVRKGCRPPEVPSPSPAEPADGVILADGRQLPPPEATLVLHTETPDAPDHLAAAPHRREAPGSRPSTRDLLAANTDPHAAAGSGQVLPGPAADSGLRWYPAGQTPGGDQKRPIVAVPPNPARPAPTIEQSTQIARPPQVEKSRQIILEWGQQPLRR